MTRYQTMQAATEQLQPPFGVLDGDAFAANAADMVRRANGTPIRIASKSIRCRELLRRTLAMDGFRGILAYTLPEALWLAQEFDDIVAINMRSVFLSCQVFADHMRSNGWGRIVNITSLAGQNGGTVASAHYAAAKAGATMLSKYFAQQLAGTGVTVNAIAPGPISTAKGRLSQEQIERIEKLVPIGRFGEASEFAAAAISSPPAGSPAPIVPR